jgi:transposase
MFYLAGSTAPFLRVGVIRFAFHTWLNRLLSFHKAPDMSHRTGTTDIVRIRLDAVHRVIRGESPEQVIAEYGFARSCIYDWLKRYRRGGDGALLSRQSPGRPRLLPDDELLEALLKPPRGLGAWSTTDLMHLIKNRFGVEPSGVTGWRILRRMGIVPVRPRTPKNISWWKVRRGKTSRPLLFVDELKMKAANPIGPAKDYVILVASTPRNQIFFQLYSEIPPEETFKNFIYKVAPRDDVSTTLVLSGSSPRYLQALEIALERSRDENANLPFEATCREQVVGEQRDQLSGRKRYKQPLVVYRLEGSGGM